MSENKGIMLAKSMQKHAGRAKEKILQNLGKVDRTADDIFDDHLNNFNRQQTNANKLQKEFNNYIRCVRAAQTASKALLDAVCEIYEPQWTGYEALQAQAAASDSLWQDFAHKLGDQVLIPLNTYAGQFPEMKKKVEKRNRKLIDYDGQRHNFQSLQASSVKRKDEAKVTKGREQLEEARRTYEILNTELHDELPALYDSRILFLVTNLQTLFATEQVFHNETAKIYSELEAIVDKLATESQRGSNTLRKQALNALKPVSPVQSPVKQLNNANINNSTNYQNQITTNGGGSLANSPSSTSSSQQEPRFDSISSTTPETTPVKERLLGGSTIIYPKIPTTPINEEPKAAAAAAVVPAEAPINDNATTSTTTTTTTTTTIKTALEQEKEKDSVEPNANLTKKIETTTNETTTTAAKTEAATATTTTTATTASAKALSAAKQLEEQQQNQQLNGNNNNNDNDNDNNEQTATTTTTLNNGNIDQQQQKQQQQIGNNNVVNLKNSSDKLVAHNKNEHTNNNNNDSNNKNPFEDDDERIYELPRDATTADLPPGVLYRVKATYGYVKEDVDELSFEIGDIIRVIEYDDPEDQEEGWLMGQKEGTNEKGLFPANFTRPI